VTQVVTSNTRLSALAKSLKCDQLGVSLLKDGNTLHSDPKIWRQTSSTVSLYPCSLLRLILHYLLQVIAQLRLLNPFMCLTMVLPNFLETWSLAKPLGQIEYQLITETDCNWNSTCTQFSISSITGPRQSPCILENGTGCSSLQQR